MGVTVLVAGVVAAVLNLILPQEDPADEEEEEPQVEVVDVEAHHAELPKEKQAD